MGYINVPILVFLDFSVLDLGPKYATGVRRQTSDVRQTDVRQHHRFMPPPIRGGGITSGKVYTIITIVQIRQIPISLSAKQPGHWAV